MQDDASNRRGAADDYSGIPASPDDFELRAQRRREQRGRPTPKRSHRSGKGAALGPRRVAALACALAGLALIWALFQPLSASGDGQVAVTIPKNAGLDQIADVLADEGVIQSKTMFKARVRLGGKSSDLKAGRFELAKDSSYAAAIDKLIESPATRTLTVTIPEGLDRSRVAPIVEQAGIKGDYMEASADTSLFDLRRYRAQSAENLEGFLFPATYELRPGASAEALVKRQLAAFEQNFASVNMSYARRKNLTPYDVVIAASMVEGEASLARERPLVAAVIYNRLREGIPLGIDATTRFDNRNWDEPLKQSELAEDSPYNTRINQGLPPGPIGNPGLASLKATARPASVDYLFYVVKPGECGEHAFSETDAEFQEDVGRYNAAREAAGGKDPQDCP